MLCDDCVVVLVCEKVFEAKNGRVMGSSSSVLLAILRSNIRAELVEESQTW